MKLDIICDICRIKMHAVSFSTKGDFFGRKLYDKGYRERILRFIQDHHMCDPDVGVRIIDSESKFSYYTDVEGDSE